MKAFKRLARLWNGERVGAGDIHLLADKVPSWSDVFGDPDQRQLARLHPTVYRHDDAVVEAFGDFAWFDSEPTAGEWFKSTYIAHSQADYDIEERTRTLINGRVVVQPFDQCDAFAIAFESVIREIDIA